MLNVPEVTSIGLAMSPLPLALGWGDFFDALPSALAGAILALLLAGPGRRWLRRLLGRESRESGERRFSGSCESTECGLREFAHEVETRLDAKLDRLERLLTAADQVLGHANELDGLGGETATLQEMVALGQDAPSTGREESPSELQGAAEPVLDSVTSDERERVLALAADGKSPEDISEAVGLIRGEVDLILRLYRSELSA